MNVARRLPFLALALVTLAIGGAWHAAHVGQDHALGRALFVFVSVLGAPFIWAQRFAGRAFGPGSMARVAGFLIGLAPYVLGEIVLRVYRRRRLASDQGTT